MISIKNFTMQSVAIYDINQIVDYIVIINLRREF
jgi:hypothetical protein